MKRYISLAALLLTNAVFSPAAQCEDKEIATALAASAAKLNGDGKADRAKALCFKSLAMDENCAGALFELGKIFEAEGSKDTASDFYVRAAKEMSRDPDSNKLKLSEARARINTLNPYASQLGDTMSNFTLDLGNIMKKNTDSLSKEESYELAQNLRLDRYVSSDKMPKFEKPDAPAAAPKKDDGGTKVTVGGRTIRLPSSSDEETSSTKDEFAPEVEKALKAAGWETIKGTWKKKGEKTYEVTNGVLICAKPNGAVQTKLLPGGNGGVDMFVRHGGSKAGRASDFFESSYASGYGFKMKGSSAGMYTPSSGFSSMEFMPYLERPIPMLPGPKNQLMISADGDKLEYWVNMKREKTASYKIPQEGNITIIVHGTMTLEDPKALGKQ